jgi:hypothetical protein
MKTKREFLLSKIVDRVREIEGKEETKTNCLYAHVKIR